MTGWTTEPPDSEDSATTVPIVARRAAPPGVPAPRTDPSGPATRSPLPVRPSQGAGRVLPQGSRPGRSRSWLVIAFALLFFFGPALAFLGGVRAHPFENHKLASFPAAGDGWDAFGRFSSWSTDHLPLREQAVTADGRISRELFGEQLVPAGNHGSSGPAGLGQDAPGEDGGAGAAAAPEFPDVIVGRDDWLYVGADALNACRPQLPLDTVLERLNRIGAAVTASGRRFVLVVAPDKSGMVPQYLPQRYVGSACEDAARRAFWDRTAAAPPPGWLDVRTPLLAAQQAGGHPWYRVHDSHWDQNAAALYGDHLAHTLDPRLRGSLRQDGTITEASDLGRLLGQPQPDTYGKVVLDRPGVRTTERTVPDPAIGDIPYLHETSTSTGPRLIPGKTVMLYDSFTDASRQYVAPWFSDLKLIHNLSTEKSPPAVAALLANSDTIIIEVVERSVATGHSGTVAEEFVSALEKQLRAHPVRSANPVRPGG